MTRRIRIEVPLKLKNLLIKIQRELKDEQKKKRKTKKRRISIVDAGLELVKRNE